MRKRLDVARIREIKRASRSLLTLHGGSGTEDHDLEDAIAAGINIVHINTELRVAWRRGLEAAFAKNPREVVPYKLLPIAEESIKQVVLSRLRLFNQQAGGAIRIAATEDHETVHAAEEAKTPSKQTNYTECGGVL